MVELTPLTPSGKFLEGSQWACKQVRYKGMLVGASVGGNGVHGVGVIIRCGW